MKELHLHFHGDLGALLARLPQLLTIATQLETAMRQDVQDLIAEVAESTTVAASAAKFIDDLQDRLEECEKDLTLIARLKSDLSASREALIAAFAANTPAVTPGETEPVNQPALDAALAPADAAPPSGGDGDAPSTDGGGV